MSKQAFDAIVIGTGQAGPSLAKRLADAGMSVAVVERNLVGGTCVNTGCIPTKAMVASAYAAHIARRAADFGVIIEGSVSVDLARVQTRKNAISERSRDGLTGMLESLPRGALVRGHGRFVSKTEVEVGGAVLTAPRIFINVGGRAALPEIPGLRDTPLLTNSSMMQLAELPRHLVVLGGSYIGLEFAQMFRRFGSEVTVIEHGPRLVGREDEDVSSAIREVLVAEGITVHTGARALWTSGKAGDIEVEAEVQAGSSNLTVRGSHLLVATGRRPNTEDLGLEAAGVATDRRGYITIDDSLATSTPGIWALGDCNGRGAFTHTAYNDFEIVAENLLDGAARRVSDRITAYALYVDPPLGRVGMTDAEVKKSGRPALVSKRPMTRVARASEKGETAGFMKVVVDQETKLILGAAIFGTGGDEVIHCILDVMYAKAPYTLLTHAVHIHPTVSELIPTLLGDLAPLV